MSFSPLEEPSLLATPQPFGLSPPTLPTLKSANVTFAETARYFHSSMLPNPGSQANVVNVYAVVYIVFLSVTNNCHT